VVEATTAWEFPYATGNPVPMPDVDFEHLATGMLTDAIAEVSARAGAVAIPIPERHLITDEASAVLPAWLGARARCVVADTAAVPVLSSRR
jgi:hypothetical protein